MGGGSAQLLEPYVRAPLAAWDPYDPDGTEGHYTGILPSNLPIEAVRLTVDPDGAFRPDALEWLRTRASFRDVADALEALSVHASWSAARRRNLDERRAIEKARRELEGG